MSSFDRGRVQRIGESVARHVDDDDVGGVAWLAACGDDVHAGVAGHLTLGEPAPVAPRHHLPHLVDHQADRGRRRRCILVEDCRCASTTRSTTCCPSSPTAGCWSTRADRSTRPSPADRPITVHDLLTFRTRPRDRLHAPARSRSWRRWPTSARRRRRRRPQVPPEPDEWMRRLGTLPLLASRASGGCTTPAPTSWACSSPGPRASRSRRSCPSGSSSRWAWPTPPSRPTDLDRLRLVATRPIPAPAAPVVYDPPDGQWATPPAFPAGGGGLVSTVDDLHAFGRMLLARRPAPDGERLLSRAAVEAMTTNQLGRRPARRPAPDGSLGWGSGRRAGAPHRARARPWAATAGPAGSARRGPTTRTRTSSACCSPPTRSRRVPAARGHPGLLDRRVRLARGLSSRFLVLPPSNSSRRPHALDLDAELLGCGLDRRHVVPFRVADAFDLVNRATAFRTCLASVSGSLRSSGNANLDAAGRSAPPC